MKKIKIFSIVALLFATFLTLGCSKQKQTTWHTDLQQAKNYAQKHNKNIFFLVSGEDWDNQTANLKTNILDAQEFDSIASQYSLLRLDFSQVEYSKAFLPDNATDEQTAEAEVIREKYEKMDTVVNAYNISEYPTILILSPEGFYLAKVPFTPEVKTVLDLTNAIESQNETITKATELLSDVKKSSGTDKAKAINEFFEYTNSIYRSPLEPLVKEIFTLDKENETGLLGKYEMWDAYIVLQKSLSQNITAQEAIKPLLDIAEKENSHLSPDEKQEAFYTAAYLLAQFGSTNFDYIYSLLEKAKNASPNSEHLVYIDKMKQALDVAIEQMKSQENVNE